MTTTSQDKSPGLNIILALTPDSDSDSMIAALQGLGYRTRLTASGEEALAAVAEEDFGLGILDPKLPDTDGLTLCQTIRGRMGRYMPVIVLGSKGEVEGGGPLVGLGADDYLPRPFTDQELLSRVKVLARMRNLQKELGTRLELAEASYTMWRNVALTDHLTKLFNRHQLKHTLASEFEGHLRYGHPLSLILVNLDNFPNINASHGQPIGDWLLRRVGDMLAEMFRKADTVARYSGREFAVLMPHCPQEEAVNSAERLRRQVAETDWDSPAGKLALTVSIGVVGLPPNRVRYSSELIDLAREAMVSAKQNGRNRVESYESSPEPEMI